jgi:two-component system sensor histidine kinase UhpB
MLARRRIVGRRRKRKVPPMTEYRFLPRTRLQRDVCIVVVATACFALLSAYFELSEAIFAWTRTAERFQLDELPGALMFLALAMAWFAWRRMRELHTALCERRIVERELAAALERNQRLARDNMRIQDEERRNLAREMHDELGQYLNAIKLDAVHIRQTGDGAIRESAESIVQSADHMQQTVRDVMRRLRPPGLDELGLPAAIEHCVDGWRRRMPAVRFALSAPEGLADLGEAINMTLYRVVQEGLTNVAKHARATRVEVCLEQGDAEDGTRPVVLRVCDDGAGARRPAAADALGIVGMRERVESLGGTLETCVGPKRGFSLVATLPMPARAA